MSVKGQIDEILCETTVVNTLYREAASRVWSWPPRLIRCGIRVPERLGYDKMSLL